MLERRPHDEYSRRILTQIAAGTPVSQRSLARELGVALGLTNLLIRRLVKKGYVKVVGIRPNRVKYLITPAGVAEKARISRAYFENTLRLYTETRERIGASLARLSREWTSENGTEEKRVVFYGAGEVAEIAYVSMQRTDLRLIGVVDDRVTRPFFGLTVHTSECLTTTGLNGDPFDCLIIMSLRKAATIRAKLDAIGFPRARTVLLDGAEPLEIGDSTRAAPAVAAMRTR